MTSSTGCSGLTLFGIAAQAHDAVAHGREVHDARHAGEILEQDARGHERDFALGGALDVPLRQGLDVGGLDEPAVLVPEEVLQQNLERVRQARHFGESRGRERGKAVHLDRAAGDRQRLARSEAVHGRHESVLENIHRTTRDSRTPRREPALACNESVRPLPIQKTLTFTLMSSILHFPDIHSRPGSNVSRSDSSQDDPQEITA